MVGKNDLKKAIEKNLRTIVDCEEGSLYAVSPLRRIITYLSGPVANFLFAVFCFIILLIMPSLSLKLTPEIKLVSDTQQYQGTYCAAQQAGLLTGDIVKSVAGTKVSTWEELENILSQHTDDEYVVFETLRGSFKVYPNNGVFGLLPNNSYKETTNKGENFFSAIKKGFLECFSQIRFFLDSLTGIFMGRNKLGETVGSAFSASENIGLITEKGFEISFHTGIRVALFLLASVSISLGLANLLPITALDGGLILISFTELIVGHTLHPKSYLILQIVGVIFVLVIIPVLRIFL